MKSLAIIGAQWGDEGKGKITDLLSLKSDVVVRYQGGNNAGHTIIVKDKKVVLYREELAGTGKSTSATDEVKQYLKNQDTNSGEKLDLPQELMDLASQAEKDGVSDEPSDSESETKVEE